MSAQSSGGNDVGASIDGDSNTQAHVESGPDGRSWLKIKLDAVHCIYLVVWYGWRQEIQYGWECTQNPCKCIDGDNCSRYSLAVSTVGTMPSGLPARTDCVFGDTVTLEKMGGSLGIESLYEIQSIGYQVVQSYITGEIENSSHLN